MTDQNPDQNQGSPATDPDSIPHEKRNLDYFLTRIGQVWYHTTESILEVATLCAEATRELGASDRQRLVEQLKFSKSTFSKLGTIGRKKCLWELPLRPLLPPAYSLIYDICKLTDPQREAAIAEKIVHRDMQRTDLERWLKNLAPEKEDEEKTEFASILISDEMSQQRTDELRASLERLAEKFPEIEVQGAKKKWSVRACPLDNVQQLRAA